MDSLYGRYNPEPCANCGKERGGTMGSSAWGHGYMCCSERCGKRLSQRLKSGMFKPKETDWAVSYVHSSDPETLRNRIRSLEHQLREHGIKPRKTVMEV